MYVKLSGVALLFIGFFIIGCGETPQNSNQNTLEELQVLKKSKMYEGVDYHALAEAIAKEQSGGQK